MDYLRYAQDPKEFLKTSNEMIQQWDWSRDIERYHSLDKLCVSQDLEKVCKDYLRYSAQGISHVFPGALLTEYSLPTSQIYVSPCYIIGWISLRLIP